MGGLSRIRFKIFFLNKTFKIKQSFKIFIFKFNLIYKANLISEFILKLWSTLINQQNSINISTVFSYEIIANVHYEICSLYSQLYYNPADQLVYLEQNTSKEMKQLADMVESFLNSSQSSFSHNSEDYTQLTTVRIKFVNSILSESVLFDISLKNIKHFDSKLINLIMFAYLNSNLSSNKSDQQAHSSSTSTSTLVEKELIQFVNQCVNKLEIFSELGIKFDSNLESFLNSFIGRFATKLKQTEDFQKRKLLIDNNLSIYFQDFMKMITSLTSISTHAIIYKCYLLASQLISNLSIYLHIRV